MSDPPQPLAQAIGSALREHGLSAALTVLIGGTIALVASVTRKAFTNDAVLARLDRELGQARARLDRELSLERDRVDRQRAEDRNADAARLERIEADIAAIRSLIFEAFQRGRTD